ncbi:DUF120 domain-containing protein [Symbiobacterium thermophilum]|nr:DUF120 domain-containing protein [Symbiobacterium thermophilum]
MGTQIRWTGRVVSGLGVAARWTTLDWFRAAIERLFGFKPVPGTLNAIAEGDRQELDRLLLTAGTVLVPPAEDICCSLVLPAHVARGVRSHPVVLLRPMVYGYNPAQVEFLAPVRLREALELRDGDEIVITIGDNAPAQKWIAADSSRARSDWATSRPSRQ